MGQLNTGLSNIEIIISRCRDKTSKRQYRCSKCNDIGYIIIPQVNAQPIIKECSCKKVERLEQQWKQNGFNGFSNELTFATFESGRNVVSKRIKEMAQKYIDDFREIRFQYNNSIAFLGEPGSGKTHICIAICLELLKQDINPVYFPYRDCIDELIDLRIINKEKYEIKLLKYKKCDLLLVDDVFKGGESDAEIRILFKIINYRYINNLPIIISSEMLSEELLKMDRAIGSRIIEMSKDRILDIVGEEYNQRLLD
jgi:DNA replication protein DnaC